MGNSIISAARDGKEGELRGLLKSDRSLAKALDAHASTPLHHAARFGHLQVCLALLEHGAHAAAQDEYGIAPLHSAAAFGHLAVVILLLENEADANAVSAKGRSALHLAADSGHLEVCVALIKAGCDAEIESLGLGAGSFREALEAAVRDRKKHMLRAETIAAEGEEQHSQVRTQEHVSDSTEPRPSLLPLYVFLAVLVALFAMSFVK